MITVHIDGACRGNPGPCGIGAIAKDGNKTVFEISEYIGSATNNIAEYFALIRALEELLIKGIQKTSFICDSQLIVEQINGNYRVKDETLKILHRHANKLIAKLDEFTIKHAERSANKTADKLANQGIDNQYKENFLLQSHYSQPS